MIWFKKGVLPKKEGKSIKVPQGLWIKCENCSETMYKKDVEANLDVCPKCNHHFRINARRRIAITLDEGTFAETDSTLEPVDALDFKDLKRYKDRLKASQKELSSKDAFISGQGRLNGRRVFVGVFEFSFMGGSMGSVVGEKIVRIAESAALDRCPLIIFSSSGGARMQEGILSLMQMAKTSSAIARIRESGVPYVSVITNPTTGGVTASFAMLGDVIIAEPNALIGFAGPRVISETIRQKLPEGFQTSEYLLEHGMLDMIVERGELKATLAKIIALLSD